MTREETYRHPYRWLGTSGGHLAQSLERIGSIVPGWKVSVTHDNASQSHSLDDKLSETMGPGILIRLSDDPSRSIRHTQVEDFTAPHQIVQGQHDLLNGGGVIPPVDIEEIDVIGLELDQRCLERVLQ